MVEEQLSGELWGILEGSWEPGPVADRSLVRVPVFELEQGLDPGCFCGSLWMGVR